MATLIKLSVSILLIISAVSLFFGCGYGLSPTISHANEPFFLPQHFPTCIYTALHSFIHTIPPHTAYKVGSQLEKEALCGANGTTILLRLRLLDSKANTTTIKENGLALHRSFATLLEEFRLTLKLRYKWAVIMSGHYWMEYQSKKNKTQEKLGAISNRKNRMGALGLSGTEEADVIDCLPRGDVLVSHNNEGGADSGFDILLAPHSIVSQNNEYFLMMQGDCNLVVYTAAGFPLWGSRSKGKGSKCSLSLLRDGNLVISNENNKRVWASGSSISCPSVFILIMQNDGNVVIYDMLSGLPIWATGTNQ